jgi:hypothetical protein
MRGRNVGERKGQRRMMIERKRKRAKMEKEKQR